VIGGVAEISAHVVEPGFIRHATSYAHFTFGELDGRRSGRVAALADALQAAGVSHRVSPDIRVGTWKKMIFLAPLSGMTSLTRLPIGPIVEDPDTRALLERAVEEAYRVARAAGTALPEDSVERTMVMLDSLPSGLKSSTLVDLERGRRLELPWLSGAIARMGTELGVPTPTHAFITTALKLHVGGHGRVRHVRIETTATSKAP
jgi:2-dehydropantoate 2-reductase